MRHAPLLFLLLALTAQSVMAQSSATPSWEPPPSGAYPERMAITGVVQVSGRELRSRDDRVAAFVDGEVRGVAASTLVGNRRLFFITVAGNVGDGPLSFRAYDALEDRVVNLIPEFDFDPLRPSGSVSWPVVWTPVAGGGPPVWSVNPAAYPATMSVVGRVFRAGEPVVESGALVGAFLRGELRGSAGLQDAGPEVALAFLTVYGATDDAGTLDLRVYLPSADRTFEVEPSISFLASSSVGTVGAPTPLVLRQPPPPGCYASSGDWSAPSTWSNCDGTVPGSTEQVFVPVGSTVTVAAPAAVGRLTVAGTLIAEADLVVSDHLANAGSIAIDTDGAVRLASGPAAAARGALSEVTIATFQNDGGTITGALTYERYYQGAEGWRLIAAPFAGVPFTTLNASFHTQGATNATYPEGGAILFGYDPTAAPAARWQAVTDYAQTAEPGRGYLFRMLTNNITTPGAPHLPGRWTIPGQENAGPVTLTLRFEGGAVPNLNNANFSLLGNPFAGPLDWHAVLAGDPGPLGATFYVWDPESEVYQAYQRTGPETGLGAAGRYIAPFQGFFAFAEGDGASVTLNQSMKAIEASPVVLGRMQVASSLSSTGFELSGEGLTSSRAYALIGGGSNAPLPSSLAEHYVQVGFTGDGVPRLYATAPIPESGEAAGFDIGVRTTRAGAYTLTWPEFALSEGWSAVLTDLMTGTAVDLSAQTSYGFTLDTTSDLTQRFAVAVGGVPVSTEPGSLPDVWALESVYPNPFRSTTTIAYAVPATGTVRIDVFDTLGRRVATLVDGDVAPGRHHAHFDAAQLSSGIYFVRMMGPDFSTTRRISVLR